MKASPLALAALLSLTFVSTASFADPPPWAGQKGKGKSGDERKYFREEHRVAVRNYYAEEYRAGNCPPGLAKKHNGCMPPGQAKKWRIGRPLPRDVVMYDLPPALVVQIGVPPAGYRYVRVASDILLIAAGTNIVAEAIRDLGRQ